MKLDFSEILYCIKKQKEFRIYDDRDKIGVVVHDIDSLTRYKAGEICFFRELDNGLYYVIESPLPKESIGRYGLITTSKTTIGVPKHYVREVNPRLKHVYERMIVEDWYKYI